MCAQCTNSPPANMISLLHFYCKRQSVGCTLPPLFQKLHAPRKRDRENAMNLDERHIFTHILLYNDNNVLCVGIFSQTDCHPLDADRIIKYSWNGEPQHTQKLLHKILSTRFAILKALFFSVRARAEMLTSMPEHQIKCTPSTDYDYYMECTFIVKLLITKHCNYWKYSKNSDCTTISRCSQYNAAVTATATIHRVHCV